MIGALVLVSLIVGAFGWFVYELVRNLLLRRKLARLRRELGIPS